MRNVLMIRREAGLVAIPVEKAVYCENCQTVSTFWAAQWAFPSTDPQSVA